MLKVNLFDQAFAHSIREDGFDSASAGRKPKEIEWVRGLENYDGITVFTDHYIFSQIPDQVKSKVKVAWIIESESIHPWAYKNITMVEDKFDYIFTYKQELLDRNPKYKRVVVGALRVPEDQWLVCPKNKLVSIIASDKRSAPGHKLRHQVIEKYKGIDLWGRGYKKFNSKLDPLKDYYFSIAIMNVRDNNYFTEVLTDCLALGTIPIFWGAPNIKEFFNINGILTFETIEELGEILEKLSKELYEKMLPAVKDNFERVKNYASTDDMFSKDLKKLL